MQPSPLQAVPRSLEMVTKAARGSVKPGTRLARHVVNCLGPLGPSRVMLTTVDAHDFYRRVGFETTRHPDRLMLLT